MHLAVIALVSWATAAAAQLGGVGDVGGVGSALDVQCGDEVQKVVDCFLGEMDAYAEDNVDEAEYDEARECMRAEAEECAMSGLAERMPAAFRRRFSEHDLLKMMAAADTCRSELAPAAKRRVEECVQEDFDWFTFPDLEGEDASAGVRLLALTSAAHRLSERCPAVLECLPVPAGEVRAAACDARTTCHEPYEAGLRAHCAETLAEEREAVGDKVCACFEEQYGGKRGTDAAVAEVEECMSEQDADMPPFLTRFMRPRVQQRIAEIKEKVCGDDPFGGVCESGEASAEDDSAADDSASTQDDGGASERRAAQRREQRRQDREQRRQDRRDN